MTAPPRDEHGRSLYSDSEVPPPWDAFAQWRGRTCAYSWGQRATVNASDHRRLCIHGWLASGRWWQHCATCRTEADTAPPDLAAIS